MEARVRSPVAAHGHARAAVRAVALLAFSLWMAALYMLARGREPQYVTAARYMHRWARGARRILGLHIEVSGPLPPDGSLLAPNHTGYLDIVALLYAVPCQFVAKREVRRWPFFGPLFTLSRNVAIERGRAGDLPRVLAEIGERLREGCRVCAFLEGTSTGGDRVLPFHSGLIEPARALPAPLVPVGIAWSAQDPRVDPAEELAFWKDHRFGPHLWHVLGLTGVRARVTFGEPLAAQGRSRTQLAAEARARVEALRRLR